MKSVYLYLIQGGAGSRPARALWIEITHIKYIVLDSMVEAREGLVD